MKIFESVVGNYNRQTSFYFQSDDLCFKNLLICEVKMWHKVKRNLSTCLHQEIWRFDFKYSKKLTWLPKIVDACAFSKSTTACLGSTTGNSSNKIGCSPWCSAQLNLLNIVFYYKSTSQAIKLHTPLFNCLFNFILTVTNSAVFFRQTYKV